MKILVTGGAGFVGSHLVEELLKRGHEIRVLVHYNTKKIDHLKDDIEIERGDLRFPDECKEAAKGVDAIAHLAALIHVDQSRRYPQMFWETNVKGTLNMLKACREENASFLHMSTCEVLGNIPQRKADEQYPFKQPRSPYAASKYAAECYCHSYHATYENTINIARCFNIFGPRQKYGAKGAVTSIFASQVLNGKPPTIYGNGEQTRDYTDVRDIARGLADMLTSGRIEGELIHLCTGIERSVNELADAVVNISGSNLKPVHIQERPGELMRSVGDNSKAKRLLGWTPQIQFEETISDVISYLRKEIHG